MKVQMKLEEGDHGEDRRPSPSRERRPEGSRGAIRIRIRAVGMKQKQKGVAGGVLVGLVVVGSQGPP